MCPFRESTYIAASEIKTLSLALRGGKAPDIGIDEASKYREFRKCYLEEYYAKDKIEEDRRFKNWKRWMKERHDMHERLCKVTGRLPASLVMNSTEGRRIEEEMKSLMHYAQTIVKPDKQRGGPEFWTPPLFMPSHDPCCCVPPLEVQRKPEELGRIPLLEHVGVPIPVREEKGLVGYHEVPDVRKRWMRSDYLEHRASALRHKVLYLADHFPDTSFMVEGHGLESDEEEEYRRTSIQYQQDMDSSAWAARESANLCPVDQAAMLGTHYGKYSPPSTPVFRSDSQAAPAPSERRRSSLREKQQQQKAAAAASRTTPTPQEPRLTDVDPRWMHLAVHAERLGSVAMEGPPLKSESPRRTIRGPPPPLLVVTPAPEMKARAKSFYLHRPTGSVALAEGPETEVEPLLLVRVVVGDVSIWREPPHAPPVAIDTNGDDDSQQSHQNLDEMDDDPVYHASGLPRWSLEFQAEAGTRVSRSLRVENTGALSMKLQWRQEKDPDISMDGHPQFQAFFLHRKSSICPPGQRCDLEVSFYATTPGLFRETWLLEAEPRIAPPCARLALHLWGIAEDPYNNDLLEERERAASKKSQTKPQPSTQVLLNCWQPVCPARKAAKDALRFQEAEETVRRVEDRRRQRMEDPWPKAACFRADCMARREQEKTVLLQWPRGPATSRQINEYLDACAARSELLLREIRNERFKEMLTYPSYRKLFVDSEIFSHLNPGYFYRAELISRLRELWKKATGKKCETWDLSLRTLREAVVDPPEHRPLSPRTQKELLEQYQDIIMQLQKPVPTTAMEQRGRSQREPCVGLRACEPISVCAEQYVPSAAEDRWVLRPNRGRRAGYAAAYSAMCVFINSMEAAAKQAMQRLGLSPRTNDVNGSPSSSNNNNNNHGKRKGPNSKGMAKAATSSTTVKARSLSVAAERRSSREVHQSKSTVTSNVSAGGGSGGGSGGSTGAAAVAAAAGVEGGAGGAGSDGESSALAIRPSDIVPSLRSQYLDILYAKTFHLLYQAVDNVAAAVDSAEMLNF